MSLELMAGLSPADIDLPPKFHGFRPQQIKAIEATLASPLRFIAHAMPTGSGKSVMYMAVSMMLGGRTAVLTSTKGLQDQLLEDFSLCGLVSAKGRNSFDCHLNQTGKFTTTVTCEDGPLFKCRDGKMRRTEEDGPCTCPYLVQYQDAMRSRLVVTNYAYWAAVHGHGQGLGAFDLLICDEAHDAADHVASSLTSVITANDLDLLRTGVPEMWQRAAGWKPWAVTAAAQVEQTMEALSVEALGGHFSQDMIRRVRALRNLKAKLDKMQMMGQGQWLVERIREYGQTAYRVGPVWGKEYAEAVLFRNIPKVMLVSATMLPKTLDMLGVPKGKSLYMDYKWQFPVERGPIIHIPTIKASYKNREQAMDLQLERIDAIVDARLDRKGIIHTISYERARQVMERSKWAPFMVSHTSARMEAQEAARQFKSAAAPCILVTPSMSTGYDFPLDECEYQIVLKAPYPDYSSELTRVRSESDPQYSHYVMVQELAQACGRGMRGADDQCETFILDDTVERMIRWKPGLFPQWFRQLYRRRDTIPRPPAPLIV